MLEKLIESLVIEGTEILRKKDPVPYHNYKAYLGTVFI